MTLPPARLPGRGVALRRSGASDLVDLFGAHAPTRERLRRPPRVVSRTASQLEMYPMPESYDHPDTPPGDLGRDADALAPASADCQVEFVEEIPTGHDTPLALEVTTILVEPVPVHDDRTALPAAAPLAFGAPLAHAPIAELTGA